MCAWKASFLKSGHILSFYSKKELNFIVIVNIASLEELYCLFLKRPLILYV